MTIKRHDLPPQQPRKAATQRLLLVNFGDRIVGYSDEPLRVRTVIAPWIPDGRMDSEVEEFVEASLSPFWRGLFWPGLRRFEVVAEKLSPSEIRHRRFGRQLLRSIEKTGRILRSESKEVRHG